MCLLFAIESERSPSHPTPPHKKQVKEGLEGATIVKIASGDCQTMALDLTGKVYGWGCYKDKVCTVRLVDACCSRGWSWSVRCLR